MSQILQVMQEYSSLREQKKLIEERMKELADKLKKEAVEKGTKDNKGSSYFENDLFTLGNVAKKSISLNTEKATEILQSMGLYDSATDTVKVINEKKLENLIADGLITEEVFESMVNTRVSYQISLKEKEIVEMKEVEIVSSKKPKLLVKKKKK